LRYPAVEASPCPSPTVVTRCGEHTDYGGLTLLYQDSCGGLEIQGLDGEWVPARPIANTIVVNIGDLMAFWSGGRYKATKHRVRFCSESGTLATSRDRYSVAMFMHPNHETKLIPFQASNGEGEREDKERPLTAGDYVLKRFSETYTK